MKIETLMSRLLEEAMKAENVGALGLLLERAHEAIRELRDDLEAMRRLGGDYA